MPRLSTGIAEVDRLLGGGLVPGSLVLLGGEPGIGKSTLVLQIAGRVAAATATDEDDVSAPALASFTRAPRSRPPSFTCAPRALDSPAARRDGFLAVIADTDVETIVEAAIVRRPLLVVVDSVQTVTLEELDGPPGSVGQVRALRLGSGPSLTSRA